MNASCRSAGFLLLVLLTLSLAPAGAARPAEEKSAEDAPDNLGLVSDSRAGLKLAAAADYLKEKDWKTAVRLLQNLLDSKPDTLARLASRDGKVIHYVSIRAESERLLATLPDAGRAVYQQLSGPVAADRLKEARQNKDARLLAEIVQRYLYTDAGSIALRDLARHYHESGHSRRAALVYQKLLLHRGLARWSPEELYQATTAFLRTGDAFHAAFTRKQLAARIGRDALTIDGRTLSAEQVGKELDRLAPSGQTNDWPIFGGNAERSAQGIGGAPFLTPRWRKSMVYYKEDEAPAVYQRIRQAEKWYKEKQQPLLTAFAPVTVTITRGEKKEPLLLCKNYWGISAFRAKTGELSWDSPSPWSLERALHNRADARKQQAMNSWLGFYLDQNQWPQVLFENSSVSTISTDGKYVYLVEDLAVPPPERMLVNLGVNNLRPYSLDIREAIQHNRLQAYDLATSGKLAWEVGGEEKGPLSDCYFLGPPLPLDGRLYTLVEQNQELKLVCLDPNSNGKVVSMKPLLRTERPLHAEPIRRTQAAHLAYSDGILVCPTNAGAVVGVDLLSGNLAWVYPYVEKDETPAALNQDENRHLVAYVSPPEKDEVPPSPPRGARKDLPPGWAYDLDGRPVPFLPTRPVFKQWSGKRGTSADGRQIDPVPPRDRFRGRLPPGWAWGPDGRPFQVNPQHNQWKASAPVISDGKVVFTPPDARSIHCLNLCDGSPLWSKKRTDDDLYLGGVYHGKVLIVGKKHVRGLSLATGATLWTLETGMPSGQGIASQDVYYLPLKETTRSKQPEICAIDMNKGQIVAHTKSKPQTVGGTDFETPGNLLFFEDDVISVTPHEIVAYPRLKVKIAQMNELLGKNPNDPAGLIERAALRLDKGDLLGGIEDLRAALKNNPEKPLRARARARLFEALTSLSQLDLRAAEKYLKEYEDLCTVEMDGAAGTDLERRRAEQRRRRMHFLLFVARLRESQGRLNDALKAYLDLGTQDPADELLPLSGEPAVKVRRDVWVRGRIAEMLRRAKPEQRKQLEEELARRLKEAQGRKDVTALRDFLALHGDGTAAGREARLQLAERLIQERGFLEAEAQLDMLRRQHVDPVRAARALEMLGRLMTIQGLMPDAAYYYRILGRDFGKTVLPSGKTGAEVWDALSTDKRFLPYLEKADPFAGGKLRARPEMGAFPMPGQVFRFEQDGEAVPFFRRHVVGLGFSNHDFRLIDRTTGEQRWTTNLPRTMFPTLVNQMLSNGQNAGLRFSYRTLGHLVVLPVGQMVFGVDPVKRRVLWEKNLAALAGVPAVNPAHPTAPEFNQVRIDPQDGSQQVRYADGWTQHLGYRLTLSPSALCLVTRSGLQAIDPLTGRFLWTRSDLAAHNRIFGDDEYVCVVEENAEGAAVSTHVLRLADGSAVRAPAFAALFEKRVQVLGRGLLLSEKDDTEVVTLRYYDIPTGAALWKQTYRAKSLVARSEDPGFTGVVEPDGKVHVIDLRTRKEVATGKMEAGHLLNVQTIHLVADGKYFYFGCHAPEDPSILRFGGLQSNLMTNLGMRAVPINGMLYAFERGTGEVAWYVKAANQMLVLEQFQELPVVLLTSRRQEFINNGGRQRVVQIVAVQSIDKRSGRIIFSDNNLKNATNFHTVRIDATAGTIDFICPALKVHHVLDARKPPGK